MSDLKDCRLLVTPTSFSKVDPAIRRALEAQVGEVVYNTSGKPLSSADVAALLPGCDGYIAGLDQIDQAAIACADRLKVISRYGVGVDKVDLAAARARGVVVTNTPGANAASVAELTIGLILNLARNLVQACLATRGGEWPRLSGLSLEGRTVGLLGLGAVGKQVARRLQAFDCRILAYEPYPDPAFAAGHGVQLLALDEVIAQADFVSLHMPLLPETRELVDAAFLRKMKPGAFLINTSRGELVRDGDLADALNSGHLAGAALDVFAVEPPGKDHPLLNMKQVIVTPHCGAHTDGASNRMARMAVEDCLAVLRGEAAHYRVV